MWSLTWLFVIRICNPWAVVSASLVMDGGSCTAKRNKQLLVRIWIESLFGFGCMLAFILVWMWFMQGSFTSSLWGIAETHSFQKICGRSIYKIIINLVISCSSYHSAYALWLLRGYLYIMHNVWKLSVCHWGFEQKCLVQFKFLLL